MVELILIGRLHIDSRKENNWIALGKFLKRKITQLEETKAWIHYQKKPKKSEIKKQLKIYNKRHDTDFFVE